ncbi:MAG: FHA domain-containing protein [candidate division Zixibacteria bacterium]|nr:FHA domain-containing protein [candidate division Zixibacteria bacterium]
MTGPYGQDVDWKDGKKTAIRKNQDSAQLVPKDLDSSDERVHEIKHTVTSIGRSPGNDIVLNDRTVSRHSATIRFEDDGYYIYDSASTIGTRVNGQRVHRKKIFDGDLIQLGQSTHIFMVNGGYIISSPE